VTCTINGVEHIFLADTGATYSSVMMSHPMSDRYVSVVGISGKPVRQFYTQPLEMEFQSISLHHSFLSAPDCPINLLGRDLMTKMRLTIWMNEDGIHISQKAPKSTLQMPVRVLSLSPAELNPISKDEEVYWLRLIATKEKTPAIQYWFNSLKTSIMALHLLRIYILV